MKGAHPYESRLVAKKPVVTSLTIGASSSGRPSIDTGPNESTGRKRNTRRKRGLLDQSRRTYSRPFSRSAARRRPSLYAWIMARRDASGPDHAATGTPAGSEIVAQADALVRRFPECFWFWHPEAQIRSLEDVRLVVRHLREYGDREAWLAARDLNRCLSPRFRRAS